MGEGAAADLVDGVNDQEAHRGRFLPPGLRGKATGSESFPADEQKEFDFSGAKGIAHPAHYRKITIAGDLGQRSSFRGNEMNRIFKTGIAVAMLAGTATPAFAQSATGSGSATIITPLSITADNGTSLRFGTVAKAAGTVIIDPSSGARSGTLPNVGSSTTGRQTFTITGDANRAFTPTIGTLTLTNSSNDTLTVALTNNGVTSLSSGTATLGIGGTLTVAADTPTGAYAGTFTVSVAYN